MHLSQFKIHILLLYCKNIKNLQHTILPNDHFKLIMSKSFEESARVWRPPPEATTSLKRELVESPESKQKLRDFTKELRNWERNGFQHVYDNTVESLP